MDRRTFIGGIAGGLLAWPLAAATQQAVKVQVVGALYPGTSQSQLQRRAVDD